MEPTDERRERAASATLAGVFAAIAVLAGVDAAIDLGAGTTLGHVLLEGGVVAVGLVGSGWMLQRFRTLARRARALALEAGDLERRLTASRAEAEAWRREASDLISGLGTAIDQQLERWQLTPAEQEIARLLLKGLSHKEVADVRGVGEATVRQQAKSIYRKSGLSGRHDLAAFFLEDLLAPRAG